MLEFLEFLEKEFNKTQTENEAKAYKSTLNNCLDLFANGAAMRKREEKEIIRSFFNSWQEDKLISLRMLFYFRDVRGGQGERRFFRIILKHLANTEPNVILKNLKLIPEYGRYDDLFVLFDTNLEKEMISFVESQLKIDWESEKPSLLAKWMPSSNASSKETKKIAKKMIKSLGLTERKYRKMLSELRKKIDVLEIKMSNKEYKDIDYSCIPSRAGMIYREAFKRNDEKRYNKFLESLESNETKVNSKTLYPYEIVNKVIGTWDTEYDNLYNGMWKNLPDYIGEKQEESIAVVDVSGSMSGVPMEVAISLGLYLAEKNKGAYKDYFITFSETPELIKIKGEKPVEKIRSIQNSNWGYNTNLQSVFEKILNSAIKGKVKQDEMIKKLYIISDMQFDKATIYNKTSFNAAKKMFKDAGYELPKVVFWNVDARNDNFPCTVNQFGFQLVSGFSPSLFKNLMQDKFLTPIEMMLEVINQERYKIVEL